MSTDDPAGPTGAENADPDGRAADGPGPTDTATWTGPPTRLDRAVAELGLARSRSHAADLVAAERVTVDGRRAAKAGTKVATGSRVGVEGVDHYVGRAAHKLVAGLDVFGIDPVGRVALDLGASTGGFTQVLLERGAHTVLAVDVGRDQLVPRLRADPRVRLVEGCNARDLTSGGLSSDTGVRERPTLVVADLSFISLGLVLPAIARVADPAGDLVLLVKPQFEVGRAGIRDGVVHDPGLRAAAIRGVLGSAAEQGYSARGIARSPIAGGNGNIEYLVHFAGEPRVNPTEWEGRIRELAGVTTGG